MLKNDVKLIRKSVNRFSQFNASINSRDVDLDNCFGEIIHNGKFAWIANGAHLEVFCLMENHRICSHHFENHNGFEKSIITTVNEVGCNNENCCFLAVGLQVGNDVGSIVVIYSVQCSKILRCIEISDRITSCVHISEDITKKTFLQLMQGCLAVGTDSGKLLLLDINFKKCEAALLEGRNGKLEAVPCHTITSSTDFNHIGDHYNLTLNENFNFGIEMEGMDDKSFILSFLPVQEALSLITGLEDGRMIIYDLCELRILYIIMPQEHLSPLSKLTYIQPKNDPQPIIYIWAFHENPKSCFAVMHCFQYERKTINDNNQIILLEEFRTSQIKLVLPICEPGSLPIRCQAISKLSERENDPDTISICLLSWKTQNITQLLIFDMNQWYKERMPESCNWKDELKYTFLLAVEYSNVFDTYLNAKSLSNFQTVKIYEEHFYPNALIFDLMFLIIDSSINFHWPGLQNHVLTTLNETGPIALLEPEWLFNQIRIAALLPQCYVEELRSNHISTELKREIILTVALEYNFLSLLKNCIKHWADGSFSSRNPSDGLSLLTLTNWIWKCASALKHRCNKISICLFDYSEGLMNHRCKTELFHLCRQLKLLKELLDIILVDYKHNIPEHAKERLNFEMNTIRMVSEYQDVLQWLLNIGLLPESKETKKNNEPVSFSYPYNLLKKYYNNLRLRFTQMDSDVIKMQTKGCRLLYIDSLIENKFNVENIKQEWQTNMGESIYPPASMQALLRTLLIPDVALETKHALFIYAFLDMNMAVENEIYTSLVQNLIKFPAVFKLNPSLIKIVQAFWNLDHGQLEVALEEILCPFLHDRKLEKWEQELMIESLLAQKNPTLALRAFQARNTVVDPTIEMKVYISNNLISEAFHLLRLRKNPDLIKDFIKYCKSDGKWNVLRDLALNEDEEKLIKNLLKESKSSTFEKPESIFVTYMLQKSKYIEAKSYFEQMRLSGNSIQNITSNDLDLSKTLLSAYNSTMTPLSKNIFDCYFNLRNKFGFFSPKKNNEPIKKPFSSELLKKDEQNLVNGLFKYSILNIDSASNYWNEKINKNYEQRMMQANNVPFVRKPHLEVYTEDTPCSNISYPQVFRESRKRRLYSGDNSSRYSAQDLIQEKRKKRIRLMEMQNKDAIFNNKHNLQFDNTYKNKDSNKLGASLSIENSLYTPYIENCEITRLKQNIINKEENTLNSDSILKVNDIIRSTSPSILKRNLLANEFVSPSYNFYIEKKKSCFKNVKFDTNINQKLKESDELETLLIPYNKEKSNCEDLTSLRLYNLMRGRKLNGDKIHLTNSLFLTHASNEMCNQTSKLESKFENKIDMNLKFEISNDTALNTFVNMTNETFVTETSNCSDNDDYLQSKIIHSEEMTDDDVKNRVNMPKKNLKRYKHPSQGILSRPPLCRFLNEKNIFKIVQPTNINIQLTDSKLNALSAKAVEIAEITKCKSDLYKMNTVDFIPKSCSSKITEAISKFTEKIQTTIVDVDIMDGDIIEETQSCQNTINGKAEKKNKIEERNNISVIDEIIDITKSFGTEDIHCEMNVTNHKNEKTVIIMDHPNTLEDTTVILDENELSDSEKLNLQNLECERSGKKQQEIKLSTSESDFCRETQIETNEANGREDFDFGENEIHDHRKFNEENVDSHCTEEIQNNSLHNETAVLQSPGANENEVINISSDSENDLETRSSEICATTIYGSDKQILCSSSEYKIENSSDQLYNEILIKENVKQTLPLDSISVESSLDSTVEITNDNFDFSKSSEADEINIITSNDHENDKKVISKISNDSEANIRFDQIVKKSENIYESQIKENIMTFVAENKKEINKAKIPKNPTEEVETLDEYKHNVKNQDRIIYKIKENQNVVKTTSQLSTISALKKREKVTVETENKKSSDIAPEKLKNEPSPEIHEIKILDVNNEYLEENKISETNSKLSPENFKIKSIVKKSRAKSVEPVTSKSNLGKFHSPTRSVRASSEQPNNDIQESSLINNLTLHHSLLIMSPGTIMTRRRSRLLNRINEDNEDTPSKNTRTQKRLSCDNFFETSFITNNETDLSTKTPPRRERARSTSQSIASDETVTSDVIKSDTQRRTSRGVSLLKDLQTITEETKNDERTNSATKRKNRCLSIDVGKNCETTEFLSSSKLSRRRHSVSVESTKISDAVTQKRRRAASSLREIVITPNGSNFNSSALDAVSSSLLTKMAKEKADEQYEHEGVTRKNPRQTSSKPSLANAKQPMNHKTFSNDTTTKLLFKTDFTLFNTSAEKINRNIRAESCKIKDKNSDIICEIQPNDNRNTKQTFQQGTFNAVTQDNFIPNKLFKTDLISNQKIQKNSSERDNFIQLETEEIFDIDREKSSDKTLKCSKTSISLEKNRTQMEFEKSEETYEIESDVKLNTKPTLSHITLSSATPPSHITISSDSTSKQLLEIDSASNKNIEKHEEKIMSYMPIEENQRTYLYSEMQRRLTRRQKNLMEKSGNIKSTNQSMIPLKKRFNRHEIDESTDDIVNSSTKSDDGISIKSSRSKISNSSKHSNKKKTKNEYYFDEDSSDDVKSLNSLKSTKSNTKSKKQKSIKSEHFRITAGKVDEITESNTESMSTTHSGPRLRNRSKK